MPFQKHGSYNRSRGYMSYLVTNLDHQTLPSTIYSVFQKFGNVNRVELGLNGNECADGTATVQFVGSPQNLDLNNKGIKIDGRAVKIEPNLDFSPRENRYGKPMNKIRFQSRSFSMGTMVKPDKLVEHWTTQNNCALIINFDMRQYHIFFDHGNQKYRAEFKFKELLDIVELEREENTWYFTFQLRYPARFWRQNPNAIRETKTTLVADSQWERVVKIPMETSGSTTAFKGVTLNESKKTPVTLILPPGMIQLGSWLVYRLKMKVTPDQKDSFYNQLQMAANYNVLRRDFLDTPSGLHLKIIASNTLPRRNTHLERATMFPYDVLYMLESVILNHYFDEINLDQDFYDMIKELPHSITCGILEIVSNSKKRVWDPDTEFRKIWDTLRMKVCHKRKIPDHCTMMRKLVVTPTSIYIQPPSLETTNRVIRHFRAYTDRFIRVQFCDDGMNRISASHTGLSNNEVYDRIYKVLTNGIQIGTRRYDFLAFSNSQLRDHGCWFFAPTKDMTASMIRDWMGRFSHVKIVAKNATRMGQCFSSTRPICQLNKEDVERIPDVERNGYTFSDGVGMISPALAREVAATMELKHVPSAFQFRLAGAKGVLTVASGLTGRKVKLRPSQIKFDSDHLVLEVIRYSTSIPAYLNKQIITILSALGVEDNVFLTLMDDMLKTLNSMLSNPSEAIKVLNSNIDEFGTTQTMIRMIQAGFMDKKDPYTVNLLNMFRVSMLKNLKKKTKINVPEGAFLLGVMDETGSLQEGEVFCQVTEPSAQSSRKRIITGDIVVYRNPCFHPGDVRVVNAVDCPKLRHLSDVVVFSSQGYRDIPSMCSGGDLDGDDYTIYWDKRLLPPTRNYTPMDYEPEKPLQVDEVHISHILKFYINYMNNDNLGQIANGHLATADMAFDGALNGSCKRLAQLHSSAVDFPKSGIPAILPDDLKVRCFPDFMQKKDKESYPSKKVLGKIFRAIDNSDYKEYKTKLISTTKYDVRLRVKGMERYVLEARTLKANYDRDLLSLMNQYGIQTEAEITSGYIIKWLKKSNRKSTHEIQQQAMTAATNLKNAWRKEFEKEFLSGSTTRIIDNETEAVMEMKAAAWYYVTYHPTEQHRLTTVEGNFLSFPWVAEKYLCKLAKRNGSREETEELAKALDDEVIQEAERMKSRGLVIEMLDSESDYDDDEEEKERKYRVKSKMKESGHPSRDELEEEKEEEEEEEEESDDDLTELHLTNATPKPKLEEASSSLSIIYKDPFDTDSSKGINGKNQTRFDADASDDALSRALLG